MKAPPTWGPGTTRGVTVAATGPWKRSFRDQRVPGGLMAIPRAEALASRRRPVAVSRMAGARSAYKAADGIPG